MLYIGYQVETFRILSPTLGFGEFFTGIGFALMGIPIPAGGIVNHGCRFGVVELALELGFSRTSFPPSFDVTFLPLLFGPPEKPGLQVNSFVVEAGFAAFEDGFVAFEVVVVALEA